MQVAILLQVDKVTAEWIVIVADLAGSKGINDLLDAITTDTTTILAGGAFLSMILLPLGWFLLGLSSLRAKVLPAISNWLVLAGALLMLILSLAEFDLDKLVFNIGLGWMGWWLWSERRQAT